MSNLHMLKLDEEIIEEIGKRFKEIRKFKNISQKDLSLMSGVSYASIKRFEQTGQISLISLISLARTIDMLEPFMELFAFKNSFYTNIDQVK